MSNQDNRTRLLYAGFMAILAAGVGFAIRGGIFDNWQTDYGFTGADLGMIGGAGFTGFCFGIIIGGFVVDKIGYGKLVFAAFALHVLSAVVTFIPGPETASTLAFSYLFWAMFIFAAANGILEAVANPLVATLFPKSEPITSISCTPVGLQVWHWEHFADGISMTNSNGDGRNNSHFTLYQLSSTD